MPLTLHEVRRIAHLARLEFTPADESAMLAQLTDFFDIVEQMSAVDTTGVEPLFTPLSALGDVSLRLRDDTVSEPVGVDGREANLRNAPAVEDGLLLVPKVLE